MHQSYDVPVAPVFSREIFYKCLFCGHATILMRLCDIMCRSVSQGNVLPPKDWQNLVKYGLPGLTVMMGIPVPQVLHCTIRVYHMGVPYGCNNTSNYQYITIVTVMMQYYR